MDCLSTGHLIIVMLYLHIRQKHILHENQVLAVRQAEEAEAEAEENAEEAFEQRRELNALRHKMHKAVEEEDFETAIELRDMIRKMENK